jgi:hypothetical protein
MDIQGSLAGQFQHDSLADLRALSTIVFFFATNDKPVSCLFHNDFPEFQIRPLVRRPNDINFGCARLGGLDGDRTVDTSNLHARIGGHGVALPELVALRQISFLRM